MSPKTGILVRVYLSFVLMLAFACVILYKAAVIQWQEGDKWRAMAEQMNQDLRVIPSLRGNIYAADGNLIATSVPVYDIVMDTRANGLTNDRWNKGIDSLALMLSVTFTHSAQHKTRREYFRLLQQTRKDRKHRTVLLQSNVSFDTLKLVKQFPLFRLGANKGGLVVVEKSVRENPYGNLARRTIGLCDERFQNKGLEAAFNAELAGTPGKRLMEKIAGGYWKPISDDNDIEPINGLDMHSTLDMHMQDIADAALRKALDSNRADYGCVIVMETHTGDIKAMANLKRLATGFMREDNNYAVNEITEPGSTFKLASVLSLLEDGLVSAGETVPTGNGTITVAKDVTIKDAEPGGHGNITLKEAFEHSSNVGIARFVMNKYGNNPSRFVNHLNNTFNLGKPLGISILGEGKPRIKNPRSSRDWSAASLPAMSIGYEVMVTPLQLATLYNGIANGGRMMKPRFVTHTTKNGKEVKQYLPEVLNEKLVSDGTLSLVTSMLCGVVEHGTATNLKNPMYGIAGKTGTARMVVNKKYTNKYKSSFVGFFPAARPQYTCLVMIFNPTAGRYYGALVAGPVFREIADKVYATCINRESDQLNDSLQHRAVREVLLASADIKPVSHTLGFRCGLTNAGSEMVRIALRKNSKRIEPVALHNNRMPGVCGMGLKDALYLLETRRLRVKYTGSGKIKSQSIPAGQPVYEGMEIHLTLS